MLSPMLARDLHYPPLPSRRLQPLNLLRIDAHLNRDNRPIKLGHGKPEARTDAGFPVLGETFFGEDGGEVGDGAGENGEHC